VTASLSDAEREVLKRVRSTFHDRYGETTTRHTPPIRGMLQAGLPVGAGTDATRVASYNPFASLYWLVTGKTVGGLPMYDGSNRLNRMEALRRCKHMK
jgi:predicted amidohydrolase YtcJ